MDDIKEELLISGTWLYDGIVKNEAHIIKTNYKRGSGDYEDEPEIRDDQFGTFYDIRIGPYSDEKPFMGGSCSSIEDAKKYAASVCSALEWNKSEENL